MSKKKTFNQITKAIPELKDDKDLERSAQELDDLKDLSDFVDSEQGQKLVLNVRKRVAFNIGQLLALYSKGSDYSVILPVIASLDSNFELLKEMSSAKSEVEIKQQIIDEMIKSSI